MMLLSSHLPAFVNTASPVAPYLVASKQRSARLRRKAENIENSTRSTRLPPGPLVVPVLGAISVIWSLLRGKSLLQILTEQRKKHGSIFYMKLGPSKQVWVSPEKLKDVYDLPGCCGRPASFRDPFGDFLFLVRTPEDAKPLREKQKAWLEKNLDIAKIQDSVQSALQTHVWPALDKEELQAFPEEEIRVATYLAVSTALLGPEAELTETDLKKLMVATREYSEMRVKGKLKGKKQPGEAGVPPGALELREVVEAAIARSGRDDIVLPLMVAASVGGAEIFPTLLHWMLLYFASHPAEQASATSAAQKDDTAVLLREIYRALRSSTYSIALGPPRKVLADSTVDDMLIPEGALLFALHPGVVDAALGRKVPQEEDFSQYAFGVGPRSCLGKPLAEAIFPAVVGAILKRYELSFEGVGSTDVQGEVKGQLIRPKDAPKLRWMRRVS
eukprot:symbB.v1.2.016056.t1/scaffold1125.1/size136522/4